MLDSRKEIQARSSGGERYPDTVEVASSNLAVPTLLEHTGGEHIGVKPLILTNHFLCANIYLQKTS